MHTKTLIFVIGVSLGIILGEVSMVASEIAMFTACLAVIQSGIYVRGKRKRKQMSDAVGIAHLFSFPLLTAVFSIGLCVGIVRAELVEEKTNVTCLSSCTFEAEIISSPEIKDEYQILKVHSAHDEKDEMHDIQLRTSLYPKYQIGETLKISGKVTTPDVILPHSDTKSLVGQTSGFDYASYLLTRNIGSEMTYPKVEVIDTDTHTLVLMLGRWKEDLATRMNMYVSSPSSQLANGMLFGSSSISKDLTQTFRTAGLSHIIVLSGFNIAVVISFVLFMFAFVPLILRITFASLFVVGFVMMVGGEASVIRATIMSFIGLLAMLIGRAYVAQQALILSLLAIVMYEPYSLVHDVSLHLSFLATSGIVYMSEPLGIIFQKYMPHLTSKSFQELFTTTISAYLSTLPYIMYTFGTISVYALLSNILALPFVPLAMLMSFSVVLSSYLVHYVALLFGFADTLIISVIIFIARATELLPFSSFSFTISFGVMCLLYCCLAFLVMHFSVKRNDETCATNKDQILTDIISY